VFFELLSEWNEYTLSFCQEALFFYELIITVSTKITENPSKREKETISYKYEEASLIDMNSESIMRDLLFYSSKNKRFHLWIQLILFRNRKCFFKKEA